MSDLLSQDEINVLLRGVQDGKIDTHGADVDADGVRSYDLASEDRVSRTRLPTLDMINERFARTWRIGLYNLLRRSVDLNVKPMEMVRFGEYTQAMNVPTNLNMVTFKPLRGIALIMCEPSLVFNMVHHFFGGGPGNRSAVAGREFTLTEMRVVELLLQQTFKDLADAWSPILAIEPEYVQSEVNPSFANVVGPREYMVVNRFTVEIDGEGGEFHIAYPFSMLDPIRESLDSGLTRLPSDEDDGQWQIKLRSQFIEADVELSSELTRRDITLRDLCALKVGDFIPINVNPELELLVEKVPLFKGEFGIFNKTNAIKISSAISPAAPTPTTPEEVSP